MVFILCCIILPKFFIIKFFQFFKTLLIPVPLPHHLLIVTIFCNIRIIQIMNLNYIVYQYLSTLTSKTLEVTTFFVGLTSCENLSVFTLWTPTKVLLWIFCGAYSTLRTSSAFHNIQKLNLTSKTDIRKTASINPCYEKIDTQLEGFYQRKKTSIKTFPYEKQLLSDCLWQT